MRMNYLCGGGDIHKYDKVKSRKLWGEHPLSPKYSIMIPTYRRPGLLAKSLASAINQHDFDNYEIIVVDNDSDIKSGINKTLQVVKGFLSEKIIYYKNECNIGIYGNTLRAAQLSKVKYVVLLNDDDLLHPMYLKVVDAFVEKYDYKGIVGARPCEFREDDFVFPQIEDKIFGFRVSKKEFFFGCTVTSPGMMYPKAILNDIYNSHEELLMGDQIIQYKALEKYGLTFIDFPLAAYRIAENATLKDDVLCDMIFHMCGFRRQTANHDLMLKLFMKIFGDEYCYWYLNSTLYFWKKRSLQRRIAERLELTGMQRWSLKMLVLNEIIDKVHDRYSKMRKRNSDYVEMRI